MDKSIDFLDKDSRLKARVISMEQELRTLAVDTIAANVAGYSPEEVAAMVEFQILQGATDHELIPMMVKIRSLLKIEKMGLYSVLPGNYSSLKEATMSYARISASEFSNLMDWGKIIFPYITQDLGMSISEFWSEFSPSNVREITPYAKAIITGEPSKSNNVNDAVTKLFTDLNADPYSDTGKQDAIETLLGSARGATNESLRKTLRPESTPPIDILMLKRNGNSYIVAELSEDQTKMLMYAFGRHINITTIDLQKENPQSIPLIRQINGG